MITIVTPNLFSEPIQAKYGLRPGLELVYTATMELSTDGAYSEQSTRVIQTRLVVLDNEKNGQWPILGLSMLAQRVLEGEDVRLPFQHIEAYRFRLTAQGEFAGYDSDAPEFGTGWSPNIYLPPLPAEPLNPEIRSSAKLPIDVGLAKVSPGMYSLLVRPSEVGSDTVLIGESLTHPLTIQADPLIALQNQEHEIRLNRKTQLNSVSQSSTQLQMETPNGEVHIDLSVENHLDQANLFPAETLPDIRTEVTNFFNYKDKIFNGSETESEENLKFLTAFSENSPVQILRAAAKNLVEKYHYDKRLEENRMRADLASQAPGFSGTSVQGEPIVFPPEKRKPTVLIFWALWWEPSEQALWDMEEIRKNYARRNLQVIGINLDSAEIIPKRYLAPKAIQIPVIWDASYPKAGIAFNYGIRNLPTIILIDKNGKIQGRDMEPEELQSAIEKSTR